MHDIFNSSKNFFSKQILNGENPCRNNKVMTKIQVYMHEKVSLANAVYDMRAGNLYCPHSGILEQLRQGLAISTSTN